MRARLLGAYDRRQRWRLVGDAFLILYPITGRQLLRQTLTERKRESSATRRRSQWPEQSQESTRLQELSYKCSHQLFSCVESFSIVLWAILLWLCDCIHGVDDVFGSTKWWRHSLRRL
ncbi:hypothetical protein KRP22_008784 [Phytophthora ramorum]|nr:hypothetical protein KRP22_7616 [Phytophthora ramorum]